MPVNVGLDLPAMLRQVDAGAEVQKRDIAGLADLVRQHTVDRLDRGSVNELDQAAQALPHASQKGSMRPAPRRAHRQGICIRRR